MKFSSSLLEALIGGVCVADDFLPPIMAHAPTNTVERVPIESYTEALLVMLGR